MKASMVVKHSIYFFFFFFLFFLLLLVLQHMAMADAEHHLLLVSRQPQMLREKAALLAFKSALTPQSQLALANWNETTGVCSFVGVMCSKWRLHVKRLNLHRQLLHGPLSPVLANLTGLQELDLTENRLTGIIPQEFSNLRRLIYLDLSGNFLSGIVPPSLSYIRNLSFLSLGNNHLVGRIPDSIFSNCTQLGLIDLSTNALTGRIPGDSGTNLPSLLSLSLYSNNLSGTLPTWLSNSSKLVQIDVESNHFYGELPTSLIQRWSYLEILHLSHNLFSSHDGNTNLEPFFLALSNCSNLEELEMAGIGVGGSLPQRSWAKSLSAVSLEDNLINGEIPSSVANLSSLTLLNLSSNLLNGSIPTEIFGLQKLERLLLSSNCLTGVIPSDVGNTISLGLLDLSRNNLSDEIPSSIGNLVRISELYLYKNQLSGPIPHTLGNCISLNILDLSYNRLSGEIPPEVSGIAKIYFNLSHNQLDGALPMDITKMVQVQEIDLSENDLAGVLTSQFSSCVELRLLNLSHNSFRGHLPASLGGLQNLEALDVSFNDFDGEIPLSLNNCTSLTFLNLSYNDFNGSIPGGGVFSSFTNLSYLGNPRLCSDGRTGCRRRGRPRRRWSHSHEFLIAVTVGTSGTAFVLTICCALLFRKIKEMRLAEKGDIFGTFSPAVRSGYPRIGYRDLAEATGEFSEERLIGSGSYGHVYRGVLRDGSVVAVKVLNLQTGNSTRSFNRECQVLKRIRHRNLMRIVTACSLPDFKALVLPFMGNGNLEHRLHSPGSEELSLAQRVSICSDVAEGMAYLHHHSPVKVIHCDLKPSNVLLNDEMTALVSDFGIARLVMSVGGGNTVENVGASTANLLCGSIGYIAPEYGYGSSATTKGDVFSFGVLLLEMVTGRRPTDEVFGSGGTSLQGWVKSHYRGQAEAVIAPPLAAAVRHQTPDVKRMWEVAIAELLDLGLLCTQESPSARPTMLEAADDLDRLKRYLAGDTTATCASSLGMSSSTIGETSLSNFGD